MLFISFFIIKPKNPPRPHFVGNVLNIICDMYERDRHVGMIETNVYKKIVFRGCDIFCGKMKYLPSRKMLYMKIKLVNPKKYKNMFAIVAPI